MTLNYGAVLVCGIVSMIVGAIWYGPLFGKTWMRIVGANATDKKAREKMQKSAGPLYFIQFILALFQILILSNFINAWNIIIGVTPVAAIGTSLLVWAAFIMPTIAGSCMWNNDSRKISWSRFLIQAGYQFILFILFGLILGLWNVNVY